MSSGPPTSAPSNRELSISGPFPEGSLLVEHVSFHETLSEPFTLEADLLSPSPDLDLSSLVGEALTLSIDRGDAPPRRVNGYVVRMALVGTFDRQARYRATLRPWLFLMSARENSRIFQNKTVPDIAKDLFREHGFSDFDDALAEDHPAREFVVQYRESDFAFVSRLLERAGIYYYFRHELGRHVLVLADSASAQRPAPGYETVLFHPEGSPTPAAEEHVSAWELIHQWRPGAYASTDFDFERPRADLSARLQAEARHAKGGLELFEYPGGYLTVKQGEAYVRARLEALQGDVELAHGAGDVRGLGAGDLFALRQHPDQSQNRRYLIVSAAFDAANNAFESGAAPAGAEAAQFHFSFSAMDGRVPFRPLLATPRPRVQGPQTAMVVGEAGQEIWTDKHGRVKVQFHWDRYGLTDEQSSCWVRVAQLWAGAQWGAMHIPRVGQEVIVDFLEGDPDRPIVTGRVYNGDNMPPYALPDNKTQSGIKSRSTPGGGPSNFNEIRFEDKKGSEELFIQAEKDQNTRVKHDQWISVGADRSVGVGGNESISVGGARTTQVKDKDTQTYGGGRDTTVSKFDNTTVTGASKNVTIDKQYNLDAAEHISLVQGGNQIFVKEQITAESTGDITLRNGGCQLAAQNAGTLTLKARQEIQLQCGAATITLKMDGSIVLDGVTGIQASAGPSSLRLGPDGSMVEGPKVGVTGLSLVEVAAPVVKVG